MSPATRVDVEESNLCYITAIVRNSTGTSPNAADLKFQVAWVGE